MNSLLTDTTKFKKLDSDNNLKNLNNNKLKNNNFYLNKIDNGLSNKPKRLTNRMFTV